MKSLVHGLVKEAEDYLQSPKGSTKSNKSGESPRTSVKGKGNSNGIGKLDRSVARAWEVTPKWEVRSKCFARKENN